MNSLLVEVANRPMAFFALAAALAAASPVTAALLAPEDEELLLLDDERVPTTPPTTAPMITRTKTGTPILSQLEERFLGMGGEMKPVDSL